MTTPATPSSEGGDGWQDIASAPKDPRQHVLLWNGKIVYEGYWGLGRYNRSKREYELAWVSSPNSGDTKPTHWQPLPKPPSEIKP